MLRRIYIDNYRCFVNFEFRPGPMNLLLGDNGSGKSTLFGVLLRLRQLLHRGDRVSEVFPTADLTAWESTRPLQRFELEFDGADGLYHYSLEVEHQRAEGAVRIRSERLEHAGRLLYRHEGPRLEVFADDGALQSSFSATTEESYLAILEPRPQDRLLAGFKRYLRDLSLFRFNVRAIRGESVREEVELSNEGDNFASFYRNLQQEDPDAVAALTTTLKRHLPGYKGLKLVGGRKRELIAEFYADGAKDGRGTYEIDFFELSDGQIMLVILYTLLHAACRPGRLLCLDEPDNYVALREIQPWLVALHERCTEAPCQVMIISHSPEVIDYLSADCAWEFRRPNAGPVQPPRALSVPRELGIPASKWIAEQLGEP